MDRSRVPDSWIGRQVVLIPLDAQGASGKELYGWLDGVQDDGIWFAKGFQSDSLKRLMQENAKFYPWSRVGWMEPED
jgi:hypothetical protein